VYLVAGVLTLGLAIFISNKLWAQPATTAAAQPKSRVALFNLTYVMKHSKKFQYFQEELKKTVEPFQSKDTMLKKKGEDLAKEAQLPTTKAQRKDEIEKHLKDLQRQIEDNKNDAQKIVVKKQEEQIKTIYMDIMTVVSRIAQSHGYEMVFHYNDALTDEDYLSAPNIARKMQAGALMPIYKANGVDISMHVLDTLNKSLGAVSMPGSASTASPKR
jgi:Skp family chaperone for outer membrane proteins